MRARVSQLVPPPRARSPRRALAWCLAAALAGTLTSCAGRRAPATRPAPRAELNDTGFPLDLPTADAPHELRALMTDITGGRLAALHARSAREGPLELTELHLELSRSRPYPSEPGEYRLSLPADVRVTRLAAEMIINGWRDAVLVPRGPAVRRGPYERPVALLRTVSAAGEPLELELEAPTIRGQHVLLTLAGFAQHLPATVAARDGPRALVRARLPDDPRALIGPVVVLVDSSASMGPSWDRLNDYLERTLTALRSARRGSPAAPELALTIIAFDQTRETVFSGTLETLDPTVFTRLRARAPLGATDPVPALVELAARRPAQALIMTDEGGARSLAGLGDALARLADVRVDIVSVDAPEAAPGLASRLEEAVRSRGAVAGLSTRMSLAPGALARALAGPVLRDASVTIPGGESVTPTRRAQLHAGVELIALATVPPGAPITLELRDDARGRAVTIPVPSRATSGPLFDYLWTAHGVDARLSEGGLSPETEAELRALSLERHVLTPQTALIALESHWEEYDNGVRDRHARAQLVVEDGAVALRERVTRALPDAHEPPGARDLTELVDERIDSTDKRRRHQVFADMYARWRELETLHAMAHRLRLAELESAALGETAEQRHQRIEYGLGEFVYSHASPRALERLVDSLRDPSLSLAAKVCRARELAGLADAEDLTWTNVELAADPPARPERLWPQSPAMAAQLADAWSAHGEPLQARRAAGSLEELGSSRLAHAAVLETISGAGAEARARLLELRAELEAEAAALPEAERPFTDAWARQLVYPDALSPRGRRAHQGALAIAYLLAVSWLREGDPQRAASSLEDWLPRVGEALADNERALFDQRSGLPPLRSLALVARRFADGGERPPTLVIGAYSPAALDLDADAISPRGVTIATSLLERGPLLSWSRWPAAVVVHHPTRARPPRSEAGDRWARVDALYSVDGGPLTVESRLVRVDHETLASVVMPEAVLRRADCDATPAANNMSE